MGGGGGAGGRGGGGKEQQSQTRQPDDLEVGVASFPTTITVKVTWGSHSADLMELPAWCTGWKVEGSSAPLGNARSLRVQLFLLQDLRFAAPPLLPRGISGALGCMSHISPETAGTTQSRKKDHPEQACGRGTSGHTAGSANRPRACGTGDCVCEGL